MLIDFRLVGDLPGRSESRGFIETQPPRVPNLLRQGVHTDAQAGSSGLWNLEEGLAGSPDVEVAATPSHQVDGVGIGLAVRAEHILSNVDPLHLADQRVAGPRTVTEFEDLRHGAFEGDRRLAHAGRPDGVGIDRGEPGFCEFVDVGRIVAAGKGGAFHHRVVH